MAKDDEKTGDDAGGTAALILLGVVLLIVVSVPLLLAVAAYWLLRPYLGRKEAWAMVGAGVIAGALGGTHVVTSYLAWVRAIVEAAAGSETWGPVWQTLPVWSLLVMVVTLVGLAVLLSDTKIASRFGRVLPERRTVASGGGLFGRKTLDEREVLLDAEARREYLQHADVVAPPGGLMGLAPVNSLSAAQPPGQRLLPIGFDAQGSPVSLSEKEISHHGLILGSTGSGKTETIKTLAGALMDLGWDGMILDLKEDTAPGGLRDWCEEYAGAHGLPYQELRLSDPEGNTWFNSLQGMGPDEMRDAILALNEFEAAYYEALNKELLGQLINLMSWAHEAAPDRFSFPTMYDVAKICGSPSLPAATRSMLAVVLEHLSPHVTRQDFQVLVSPTKAQQEAATGFGSRLGNLFDTQAGRAVLRNNAEGTRVEVDATAPGLTYIGLDSQGKADLTRMISSALLQRMSVYAAQRTTGRAAKSKPRFLIVDEANWVNRRIVMNILSRARSAGIALILCTQGPDDWNDKQGQDFSTLVQNMTWHVIMRQNSPDAALMCAELIGKEKKIRKSERIDQTESLFGERRVKDSSGRVVSSFTVSEEVDYKVPPDTLRQLDVGQAFVNSVIPTPRLVFTRVAMRDPSASPAR